MSLKLYHAFKLNLKDANLATLNAWASPLRQALSNRAKEILLRWLIRDAIDHKDHDDLSERKNAENYLVDSYMRGLDRIKETLGYPAKRDTELDTTASVQIYLDPEGGGLYGLYFIEHPELIKLFLADPAVVSTPYYDNTDRPSDLTEADWKARAALWERLLPDSGIPNQGGVTVELAPGVPELAFPDEEEMRAYWPSLEQRLDALSRDAAVNEVLLAERAAGLPYHYRRAMHHALDLCRRGAEDRTFLDWIIETRVRPFIKADLAPSDLKQSA